MQGSNILDETLRLLRYGARRIIHQGGQWSGKTVNILGALAVLCTEDEEPTVTTITSMSFPHLKGGALRDFEVYVQPSFKQSIRQYHRTDHIFTFKSGSILEFKVFENEETARGPKRKRLFINEANKFDYMTYWQLDSRSEQTIIDYNPSIRFWSHEKLIGEPENTLLISDHRHNPFLTQQKHKEIEAIKDPELWKVYARGLTGNITGVIFPDWEMIDDSLFPTDEDFIWGIDFGYTNDPTAIMKMIRIGDTLFVKEIAYETGLPPISIKQILLGNGYDIDNEPLFCEHDPDMIKALRNVGIVNAFPARKGQGSVNAGIELLKTFRVRYTNSSRNLHRERSMYIWMPDKVNPERLTNIPIDSNNHCFIGETKVKTINGESRIDKIEVGDFVLTSNGYRKVTNVFNNGVKQVSEYFINGVRLVSTPNHRVKTKYGWKPISQIRERDSIYQLKNLMVRNTDYIKAKGTLAGDAKGFILSSMSFIVERFHSALTYIISMETLGIIELKILNLLKNILTKYFTEYSLCMTRIDSNLGTVQDEKQQKYGTLLQKVLSSIELLEVNHTSTENQWSMTARSVEKNSSLWSQKASTAIQTVKLKHFEQGESWKERVYDIEVEDCHEYFANGVLVHNCFDAIRYGVYTKYLRNKNQAA